MAYKVWEQRVLIDMPEEERDISMRCLIRHFHISIVVLSLLTLSILVVLQSMLYRIHSRMQPDQNTHFQTWLFSSFNAEKVRKLHLQNAMGNKNVIDNGYEKNNDDGDDDNEDDDDEDDDDDENDTYYYRHRNPVFKLEDFDPIAKTTKARFIFHEIEDPTIATQTGNLIQKIQKKLGNTTKTGLKTEAILNKMNNKNAYTEGVFWTESVERLVPKGPSVAEVVAQTARTQKQNVTILRAATWNKCGRVKNGFIVMSDNSQFCVRYRAPHQNLILGEVLSYYLSRLLGMDNVPFVVLSHTGQSQWSSINYTHLEWQPQQIVALIHWTHGLNSPRSQVKMPKLILDCILSNRTLLPVTIANLNLTKDQLIELVQWGEMIIFDYITGNYDRVASMQDGAEREHTPSILSEYIRNLHKHETTSKFWLIDNESGLLDAYDLLYQNYRNGPTFAYFHTQMLRTLCIFKQPMVTRLKQLLDQDKPHNVLLSYAHRYEPLLRNIKKNWLFDVFKSHFSKRLNEVYVWIQKCISASR